MSAQLPLKAGGLRPKAADFPEKAGPFLFLIFWGSDNQETDQNIVDINACELQVDKI